VCGSEQSAGSQKTIICLSLSNTSGFELHPPMLLFALVRIFFVRTLRVSTLAGLIEQASLANSGVNNGMHAPHCNIAIPGGCWQDCRKK
jgi:hypothetical protein